MKTTQMHGWAWFAMTAWTAVSITAADSVATCDGTKATGSIVRLTAAGVALSDGQTVAWTNVARLGRDRPLFLDPGQRLVLRNGTALCGLVRRTTKDSVVFRSVTAGELEVVWTNVSAIRFEAEGNRPPMSPTGAGGCEVVKTDGKRIGGSLVMATRRHLLLRTSEGLGKVDAGEVAWLIVGPPPAAVDALMLRNGDRLCGPVTWRNEMALVEVNGKKLEVHQAAIQQMGSR